MTSLFIVLYIQQRIYIVQQGQMKTEQQSKLELLKTNKPKDCASNKQEIM